MNRRKVEEIALAVVLVLGVAGLVTGAMQVSFDLGSLGDSLPGGETLSEYSTPVLIGLGLLLSIVVAFGLAVLAVRFGAGPTETVAGSLTRVVGAAVPDSPLVRAAALVTIGLFAIMAIIGLLPTVIGDPAEADNSPINFEDQLGGDTLNAEWDGIVGDDGIEGTAPCAAGDRPAVDADRDGDGLADSWEREGRTPGGAPLPDADPDSKDLYVQVNTGSDVSGFSADERDQLRRVWAEMPVANPDGSEGVDLHLVVDPPAGGDLGNAAILDDRSDATKFYTQEHLDERACIYHQVTLGTLDLGETMGVGQVGGFASVVEATEQPEYDGDVSFRVAVTTHELLHNVAGRVDGELHTESGWLAGGPDNEFFSDPTVRTLDENGFATAGG